MRGDISPEATPMTKGGSLAASSLETPRAKSRCIAIKEPTESQGRAAMLKGRSDDRTLSNLGLV